MAAADGHGYRAGMTASSSLIPSWTAPFSPAMADALAQLGATPQLLREEDRAAFDRDGYLVLPEFIGPELLQRLRDAHEQAMARKYPDPERMLPVAHRDDRWNHEPGTRRIADLLSEDPAFDRTYTDPRLLAAVAHVFRCDFKLNSINARDALPGGGAQDFHRDGTHPEDRCAAVNSAWLLDDVTPANGATRVLPGSHRTRSSPPLGTAPQPGEQLLCARAGSVLVFRGDLLHSGTTNRTSRIRRLFHVFFCERTWDTGDYAPARRIRKATWDRLSPAARFLLDV